jgi:hypothetical protein
MVSRQAFWRATMQLPCPYLGAEVLLSPERERHIAEHHPDLLPEYLNHLAATVSDPDEVRKSARFSNARLFSRWFDDLRAGKYVVVVVVCDDTPERRHWVVTAYLARRIAGGVTEWQRS